MVCCFFGHKDADTLVKRKLRIVLNELVAEGVNEFLVGNQGRFDSYVLAVLRELKESRSHISYRVVLAYMPGKKTDYEQYAPAETIYPEGMESIHPRYAISKRNEYMIREADMVVTYVTHSWGGAAKFAELAAKKGKRVINIADLHKG